MKEMCPLFMSILSARRRVKRNLCFSYRPRLVYFQISLVR